ncbi:hypothetical protein BDV19DRAFT_173304 [Aspergillus venezuelensis]
MRTHSSKDLIMTREDDVPARRLFAAAGLGSTSTPEIPRMSPEYAHCASREGADGLSLLPSLLWFLITLSYTLADSLLRC